MDFLDQPLGGGKKPKAKQTVSPLQLTTPRKEHIAALARLESMCYPPRVDPDFEVEVQPLFVRSERDLQITFAAQDKTRRMVVITRDDTPLAGMAYEVDQSTRTIDITWVTIAPKAPAAVLTKMFDWVLNITQHSLKEYTIMYDFPDCFAAKGEAVSPMQVVFEYLVANNWDYKRVSDVFKGNVDAWRFRTTAGAPERNERLSV